MEDEIEVLIGDLARAVSTHRHRDTGSILLYAEAGDGWSGGSIFVPNDARIEFVSPPNEVFHLVERLWSAAPENKQWRGITMRIDGNAFRAEFDYGEGWSETEREGDRRIPIVRAHFGDKPIFYPPLLDAEPWECSPSLRVV